MIDLEGAHYQSLLLAYAGSTLFMVGLIWLIQVVHYPLFAHVGAQGYQQYQVLHMTKITWVVAPMMIVELSCAGLWALSANPEQRVIAWVGLALVGLIWLSTATLQVPAHAQLTQAWDAEAHARLVSSNWVRTVAWSLRGCIALWALRSS